MPDSHFDFRALRDVTGDDPEFEREILRDFLLITAETLERVQLAAEAGDAESLQRGAHSIVGASRTVGAQTLGELAHEVEDLAGRRDLDRAVASLARAVREYDALRAFLEQHLRRMAA